MSRSLVVRTESAAQTHAVGAAFGRSLQGAQTLSLQGPLGAGKTVLVAGICEGLGVVDLVTSPTYTLFHEYVGNNGRPVIHVDCFRLEGASGFEDLDVASKGEDAIVVIEWGDRVEAALGPDTIRVRVEPEGETTRRIVVDVPEGIDLGPLGTS